jgi:hypothetical protein
MKSKIETTEPSHDNRAKGGRLHLIVRRFLEVWCSEWRWARKLHGGRWERWWADPVNALVWMHEPKYLEGENRPGGCDIGIRYPRPHSVEVYPANS